MQNNINSYDPDKFKQEFVNTELYRKLQEDFDIVYFGNDQLEFRAKYTPRQFHASRKFSLISFYYLKFLTDQHPKNIYDLGCGWNIFKKYIPNIIGIDRSSDEYPLPLYADIDTTINDDFIKQHQNYFESVFSINALHFYPLSQLRNGVLNFISMIAPGGHGFLSLNLERMIELDPENFQNYNMYQLDQYIRSQLHDIPAQYLVFDLKLDVYQDWNYSRTGNMIDGNIRLVCHKIT